VTVYSVDTKESFQDVLSCLEEGVKLKPIKPNVYKLNDNTLEFTDEYSSQLELHDIIYGLNKETNIVNISLMGDCIYIFKEKDGRITAHRREFRHWALAKKKLNDTFVELSGKQPYKFYKDYSKEQFESVRKEFYKLNLYTIYHHVENHMVRSGMTYFKGMKLQDVSLLSFDIETTGLNNQADDAEVLLITNTYRNRGAYESKTFCVEDYANDGEMISDWCAWVRKKDPSVLLGHNIVTFDIPYLAARAGYYGKGLVLGRMDEQLEIEERAREFRKDGSQSYTYHRINCFGREVIDTFFLAIKADVARKYESYRLKGIIKQEGLEEEGRVHYPADQIKTNWDNPEERKKIIAYGEADSRDPIKLFDLMIPSFFYLTPYIPKPFQIMIESATGSQINSLMVRSYLQKNMSVAESSPSVEFEGAISFGNPGIYDNVFKVDVASLYPSIMRHYKVHPKGKDYNDHFLKMLNYFTLERLKNKKLAKDSGDRFYDDLQNSQKIVINSAYGFMGASGLNYNYPEGAAEITRHGREIITKALDWAKEKEYAISNCDTDSISIACTKPLSKDDRTSILKDLNGRFPSSIVFEDDGFYPRVVILRAKNYILFDGEHIKLKGSGIRDQKKEPALKEMIDKMIDCLVFDGQAGMVGIYESYIKEAFHVKDIGRWATKKTITKAILNCAKDPAARLNERKVYEAVKDVSGLQEGDKEYLYPCVTSVQIICTELKNGKIKEKVIKETGLKRTEAWDHDEDKDKLVERVIATVEIFNNVFDTDTFIDYSLIKNKNALTALVS